MALQYQAGVLTEEIVLAVQGLVEVRGGVFKAAGEAGFTAERRSLLYSSRSEVKTTARGSSQALSCHIAGSIRCFRVVEAEQTKRWMAQNDAMVAPLSILGRHAREEHQVATMCGDPNSTTSLRSPLFSRHCNRFMSGQLRWRISFCNLLWSVHKRLASNTLFLLVYSFVRASTMPIVTVIVVSQTLLSPRCQVG